uniref:MAM domain-containing protein n=1 Tax=Plectus sambesii TaxID=2011161 RepID=A0A914V8Q8_9BILA
MTTLTLTKGELLQKNVETIASRETEANVDTKVPCKGPNGLRYCALKCRQDNRNRVVRPTCTPQPEGDQSECQCGAEEGEIEAGRSENGGVIQARDQSTAPSADQTFPTSAACDILRCDFEQFDLCGWKDLSGSRADFRRLIVAQRRPGGTSSTSIPDAVHGRRYVISRLGANGKVGMVAEGIELREPLVMRMEIFRTAENLDVKVCLNSIDNCVSKENSTAEWQLRTWQETYVSLPQDTSKIFIIGENNGTDWSALGIDKIELLQWPADSNKTPTELAC